MQKPRTRQRIAEEDAALCISDSDGETAPESSDTSGSESGSDSESECESMVEEDSLGEVKVWIEGRDGSIALFVGSTVTIKPRVQNELGYTTAVVRAISDDGMVVDGYCNEITAAERFGLPTADGGARNFYALMVCSDRLSYAAVGFLCPAFETSLCRVYHQASGTWTETPAAAARPSIPQLLDQARTDIIKGILLCHTELYKELFIQGLKHCLPSTSSLLSRSVQRACAPPVVRDSEQTCAECVLCRVPRQCHVCTVAGVDGEFAVGRSCLQKMYVLGTTLQLVLYCINTNQCGTDAAFQINAAVQRASEVRGA